MSSDDPGKGDLFMYYPARFIFKKRLKLAPDDDKAKY